MDKTKILKAPLGAVTSKGFIKTFLYSFGSFLAGWSLIYLASPETALLFGERAWIIPTLNTLIVLIKQSFDSYRGQV